MSPPDPSQTPHQATILIIDDEPIQLRAMVAQLNALGFETLIARNGPDGLAKAGHGHPDLILLDIVMPGWDGYETCRRLKADPATHEIPVIFLSALDDTRKKLRGFEAGCIDYITKPFEQREVLARVAAHLQQRRLFRDMAARLTPPGDGTQPPATNSKEALTESKRPKNLQHVYQAMDILLSEMHDPPSRVDLAHRVGTNESSLGLAFQHHLGMSPYEYLREQRLAHAQTLLTDSELQVQQIANTVGFKRTGDFGTAFKRRFGQTPRDYRKQRQQSDSLLVQASPALRD